MREIKFRYFDPENKVMVTEDMPLPNPTWILHNRMEEPYVSYILMQYTGLKDKNGKEIYEGDIVKVYDFNRGCQECNDIEDGEQNMHRDECENYLCTQEIKWSCGYFCDEDTGDYCPPLSNDEIEMEIIGNIYENPEILKD